TPVALPATSSTAPKRKASRRRMCGLLARFYGSRQQNIKDIRPAAAAIDRPAGSMSSSTSAPVQRSDNLTSRRSRELDFVPDGRKAGGERGIRTLGRALGPTTV